MQKQQRIYQLDIIRSIAIASVVLIHCAENTFSPVTIASLNLVPKIAVLALFVIGRVGVPLFLILTGFLFLSRDYSTTISIKKFYFRNLIPLLVCWLIWVTIYNIFDHFARGITFSIGGYISQILFLMPTGYVHAWYMPMIIGIYVFIPLIARALKGISLKVLLAPITIAVIYFFVFPTINRYLLILELPKVNGILNTEFSGGNWGVYLIIGYLLNRYQTIIRQLCTRPYKIALTVLLLCATGFSVLYLHHMVEYKQAISLWYDTFTLPILAVCVFILVNTSNAPNLRFFKYTSIASFGIYLIHPLAIIVLSRFSFITQNTYIALFPLFFITFGCSFAITLFFYKVLPKLSRLLFITK